MAAFPKAGSLTSTELHTTILAFTDRFPKPSQLRTIVRPHATLRVIRSRFRALRLILTNGTVETPRGRVVKIGYVRSEDVGFVYRNIIADD